MKTTRRSIEFTVEKSKKFLIRRRQINIARCDICECESGMLPPEEAASLTGISPRTIYRLIEAAQIHFIESSVGHLLVCLDSLSGKKQVE